MIIKEEIRWKGVPTLRDAVRINNQTFLLSGNLLKTASLKKEWHEDVRNPEEVIETLKRSRARVDILRFWQRVPDTTVKYSYYHEWQDVAAIRIKDFETWWHKQINDKTRNMVRKAQKRGVAVRPVEFDDQLVRGIMEIFNESPVRRGKPFWHYGKNFSTVKKELADNLEQSIFIGAYYEQELIGFIKLLQTERYTMVTMILDKMSHRERSPMNGMIAKAVEICAALKVPYLTYTVWRRSGHGEFQKRNGFEKIPVPEYFVPLTLRGELAVKLRLHKGIRGLIPENMMIRLLALRTEWYAWKYRHRGLPESKRNGTVPGKTPPIGSNGERGKRPIV